MSKLKYLVIHCSATIDGVDIRPEQIKEWHMGKNGRGWSRVGYSDLITLDGKLHNMHFAKGTNPYDDTIESSEMTWGVKGQNQVSKHICYVGGLDKNKKAKNTMNKKQIETLKTYIEHELLRHPDIKFAGHNQFSTKSCPCYFVPDFFKDVFGIDNKNLELTNPHNRSGY